MENEKVIISEEIYSKIKITLKMIKVKCEDKDIKKKVDELLSAIEENSESTTSLTERIRQKMMEVKSIDSDMHTDLYILYRKLVDNKISEKEASDAFEAYDTMMQIDFYRKVY